MMVYAIVAARLEMRSVLTLISVTPKSAPIARDWTPVAVQSPRKRYDQ
ncbi:MAG: hypothetical protein LBD58_06140 [Treponema sp.]|jgi:hypothetical protein|nr:hypothetical protein [Treponema sp.]